MHISTVLLINEIMDYMYNQEWISLCCGHNGVFSGWIGHDVSCSLVSFLLNWSRIQWFPLSSISSDSSSLSQKSLVQVFGSDPEVPFSFLLSPFYMRESLEVTSSSLANDGFLVIITFFMFSCSFSGLQSHLWQRLSGFWECADWWCLVVMLYFLIVILRSQFTQPLLYAMALDRSGKRALALTKQDRYPSSMSQLCGLHRALRGVLSGLVLLSSCRHITPSLIRSRIMTWLSKLARHTKYLLDIINIGTIATGYNPRSVISNYNEWMLRKVYLMNLWW